MSYWLWLWSLLVFVVTGSGSVPSEAIPKNLRDRLKSAHTLHEIMNVAKVMYSPRTHSSGAQAQHAHAEIKMHGASFIAMPFTRSASASTRSGNVQIDDHTQANLAMLSTIRQGNDTCQLQNVCVPIPVENPDPSILIFPRCYEVTQCVGSCCDAVESCHPTAIEKVTKPIVEMMYTGNNRFVIKQTRNTTMEQHLACSCRDCSAEGAPPECPRHRVIGPSCSCECRNQLEKTKCRGNWQWNELMCKCECGVRGCGWGEDLNEEKCECVNDPQRIVLEQPDERGNYRSDVSRLPKLRSRTRVFSHQH